MKKYLVYNKYKDLNETKIKGVVVISKILFKIKKWLFDKG